MRKQFFFNMTAVIIVLFEIQPLISHATCPQSISNKLSGIKTPEDLSQNIKNWGNELTIDCYLYVGEKYLSFYKKTLIAHCLDAALKYLTYTSQQFRQSDHFFERSQKQYNEATLYQSWQKEIAQLEQYSKNPFRHEYPLEFIQLIRQKGIRLEKTEEIQSIYRIVSSFKTELTAVTRNQFHFNAMAIVFNQNIFFLQIAM
ncbi:MAG: hypothetical protein HQK75_18325 [Candidatus Magnetomorum sp.]|nr:hypothetical protein [Candidatus Magnetomorum sp.]